MRDYNSIIAQKLLDIERAEKVRIIYACESGSRAWGFASPDSDYDVRFIYVRSQQDYLRLDEVRDVIEWQLDDELDINGWDLKKALKLIHAGNQNVFEWANSPMVYRTTEQWEGLKASLDRYFNPQKAIYHYLSMAKHQGYRYVFGDGQLISQKKYLYVSRAILSAKRIIADKTIPCIEFNSLLACCNDPVVKAELQQIVKTKMTAPESVTGKRISALDAWLDRNIEEIEQQVQNIAETNQATWENLNATFIRIVTWGCKSAS